MFRKKVKQLFNEWRVVAHENFRVSCKNSTD
jgi:hypothetical protein